MGNNDEVIRRERSDVEREAARRSAVTARSSPQSDDHGEIEYASRGDGSRRRFLGRSGRILIYTPPLIQLFFPTKAMAASPSS